METERLVIRPFKEGDEDAVWEIFGDRELNRFLPMFPLESRAEAKDYLGEVLMGNRGRHYAVCRKEDNRPVGYVTVGGDGSHDLGYGLLERFRGQGLITEACRRVVEELKKEGIPYLTATHDVDNPKSGEVMKRLGMTYCYSYREQWQPKNIPVVFRMYQMNLDGNRDRVYRKYWEKYPHFVEEI